MNRRLQDFLVLNFPTLEFTRDAHDIILDSNLFEILLTFNEPPRPTEESSTITKNSTQNNTKTNAAIGPANKMGRKPLYIKFASLLQSATDFIKSHSFEAHNRRRETTGIGTGVSLKDLQKHLLQNVPGLKEHGISRDTIHHLMIPSRKSNRQSIRYAGVIDAKISRKRNNYPKNNVNQHFLFSRVAYREEFCSMFAHESKLYSADDMNKIKMGPATAVS